MGFRLVPKSVTLNDPERRNDRYLAFFSPNSVALGADYVKVVKIDLYSLRRKYSPKNLVFSDISFMAIFAEVTENERIIDSHASTARLWRFWKSVYRWYRFDSNRPISTSPRLALTTSSCLRPHISALCSPPSNLNVLHPCIHYPARRSRVQNTHSQIIRVYSRCNVTLVS